jgi:hypothetical protein
VALPVGRLERWQALVPLYSEVKRIRRMGSEETMRMITSREVYTMT